MNPYKIVFLFLLSFLSASAYSQDTPAPDSVIADGNTFLQVDSEASFPGGFDGWRKFLEKNLNPNVPVDNGAPTGLFTVLVQFVVDIDGSISEIKPLTKLGYGMEQEVVRILKKSGAWTPAMQNERPVRAYRKQPVTFMVSDERFDIISKIPFVLYTGSGNELTVKVDRVKDEDVHLTISQGTVTASGDGKFIARVNKPGRVIIDIYNSRKNKKIGSASFEVRDGKELKSQ
jgi:hypothetical protein